VKSLNHRVKEFELITEQEALKVVDRSYRNTAFYHSDETEIFRDLSAHVI
jgi:hypothetical protein